LAAIIEGAADEFDQSSTHYRQVKAPMVSPTIPPDSTAPPTTFVP
jgi:hypothetical protein